MLSPLDLTCCKRIGVSPVLADPPRTLGSASTHLPGHRYAPILPIKGEGREGEREGERQRGRGGLCQSVRASSRERFALPHRTPRKPPCRRSQEAAVCVAAAGRDSPRTHGFYRPSAGKMVLLLLLVALSTRSIFSGASAAAHREYLSPVCCSAAAPQPSQVLFFRCFYARSGAFCPAGAAAEAAERERCAFAHTLQTTFRLLLFCVGVVRIDKLARTLFC